MKITRLETIPIRVPLNPELAIRSGRGGAHEVSPFLLVRLHTNAGITGLGEVSCTPRWSGEDQFTAQHLLHTYLAPLLVGADPLAWGAIGEILRRAFAANPFTKAAVEMALWDIAGKAAGQPVYALLGGQVREFVPTKWSVTGVEPARAAAVAAWAIAQGFRAMKVKVGIEPDADVARVEAVRAAIGPAIKLGVDANGGWSVATALAVIPRLSHFDIGFVEQPVAPEDLADFAAARRGDSLPIIADESVYTMTDAKLLARSKAADVFSIYVGKAGGIGPARRIAEFARSVGIKCTLGSNLELGVGSAAMTHLAIATAAISTEEFPCDIIGPFYYTDDVIRERLPISPGVARASTAPGLGVELDEAKVAKYRVE